MAKTGVVFLFCCLVLGGCLTSAQEPPVTLAARAEASGEATYAQWLGTSSWIISRGNDAVVVDPFFTRPSLVRVALSWLLRGVAVDFRYDADRIAKVLPAMPENTRYVLLGHAHYDHIMDIPYYLTRTAGREVTYIGSDTARNILSGFTTQPFSFHVPQDGQPIGTGRIRITAFTTDHAPHILGLRLMSGHYDRPLAEPPAHPGAYLEGTTYIFFIDFLDERQQIVSRILVNGAANSPEGLSALRAHESFLRQHPTNIAILCVPGWNKVRGYPNSLLQLVNPRHVVLSHSDDFFRPYKNGEDPRAGMDFVPFAKYGGFIEELNRLRREYNYTFELHQPKTGQCLRFPAGASLLECEG